MSDLADHPSREVRTWAIDSLHKPFQGPSGPPTRLRTIGNTPRTEGGLTVEARTAVGSGTYRVRSITFSAAMVDAVIDALEAFLKTAASRKEITWVFSSPGEMLGSQGAFMERNYLSYYPPESEALYAAFTFWLPEATSTVRERVLLVCFRDLGGGR